MSEKPNNSLRWILRGLSGLLIAFFALMFLGENLGSGSLKPMPVNEIVQLSVMGTCLLGLGLAWKWELIGGIIALIAFIILVIINPTVLKVSLMFIFPITALSFVVLGALSRKSLRDWIDKFENRP